MEDIYYIPSKATEGLYKEKGSKFHSYLFPIDSVETADERLLELKKLHPKSRHVCYGYRLSPKEQTFRINDDGEPSGTAGKPIFNQILSAELHGVLVAVVRYFGGTKLGASGLIRAYKTAAEEVCQLTDKIEKFDEIYCKVKFRYAMMGDLMHMVKHIGLDIHDQVFEAEPYIVLALRKSMYETQINTLKAALLNRDLTDIEEDTEVDGVEFLLV